MTSSSTIFVRSLRDAVPTRLQHTIMASLYVAPRIDDLRRRCRRPRHPHPFIATSVASAVAPILALLKGASHGPPSDAMEGLLRDGSGSETDAEDAATDDDVPVGGWTLSGAGALLRFAWTADADSIPSLEEHVNKT